MKFTLITGSSSGIGKALAYEFASKGHHLILVARRKDRLCEIKHDLEKKFNINVVIRVVDLTHLAQVIQMYESLAAYDISVLINNAGIGDYSFTWDADIDKLNHMIDLNIKAVMNLSLLYVKEYQDCDNTLINVSSGGGYFVFNKAVPYCASKFFVSSFTEGLAQNLMNNSKKLRVKVLCPGGTQTEFVEKSESSFRGQDIFDVNQFMAPEQLAKYAYELYESDAIIGMVQEDNSFELRKPIFPYGG